MQTEAEGRRIKNDKPEDLLERWSRVDGDSELQLLYGGVISGAPHYLIMN